MIESLVSPVSNGILEDPPVQDRRARYGSKEWANDQLKFAIGVLKGQRVGSRWPGRVQIALLVKDRLIEYGWTWQAERVENWIHRLQPRRADPRERQGGIP